MSKAKARVFVPLTKVDEEQRLVYGRITQELLDKSNEVMDYATSKEHFEKWSNDIHEASGGLSKGNVRVMHGLTAAGKLTELDFNDEEMAIDVCAKVVDDKEWEKVTEGVYTGFSVGGSYAKRWTDNGVKKFTAKPNEVSLVDNPCVPSATFTMFKADGAEEEVEFQVENDNDLWPDFAKADGDKTDTEGQANAPIEAEKVEEKTAPPKDPEGEVEKKTEEGGDPKPEEKPVEKVAPAVTDGPVISNAAIAEKATELMKAAGDPTKDWMDFIPQAREELTKGITATSAAMKNPKDPNFPEPKPMESLDDRTKAKENEAPADDKEAGSDDAQANKAEHTIANRLSQKWVTSDGQAFVQKNAAMKHEAKLVKAAEDAKPKTDAEKLAARLAKAMSDEQDVVIDLMDDLPRLANAIEAIEAGVDDAGAPKMQKGMYTVSRFARMIADMASLTSNIRAEGAIEGDDGGDLNVSSSMKASLSDWAESFKTYADQQVTEILAGIDTDVLAPCYDYYYACAKADGNDQLAKDVVNLIDEHKVEADERKDELAKAWGIPDSEDEMSPSLAKRFDELKEENATFKKIAEDAVASVEQLTKRVETVENTAKPRVPRGPIVDKGGENTFLGKTVASEEDKLGVLQEMLKTHGPDAMATMMIKASHQHGIPLSLKKA